MKAVNIKGMFLAVKAARRGITPDPLPDRESEQVHKRELPPGCIEEVLTDAAANVATKKLPNNIRFEPGPTWDMPTKEIIVIGQTAAEACEDVDRFLDKASLGSIARVRIIHGHGYGVLKRAIQEMLAKHPHVARHFGAKIAQLL